MPLTLEGKPASLPAADPHTLPYLSVKCSTLGVEGEEELGAR